METKRLRAIQQPSQVERLLEAYITRGNVIPPGSYQIRDPDAVIPLLRSIALRAAVESRAWACWAYGFQHWLFTAELSLPLSRERRIPVLYVHRYNEYGELMEAGPWLLDADGSWRRCGE